VTSVFLSYARSDDETFARRLHDDLTARGIDVWFDREDMPSRALTFLHEIREAINERDRLVLVVGPGAVISDYVEAEWRHALEMGKPVNPVLRLGDYDLLPPELRLLDTPDFRDDDDYEQRLETLARQLSEPVPPMGKLVSVPSLPAHFLEREDRLRALKQSVMADLVRPQVVTGTQARTGVHGMGGIGKSVLATALARDTEVRRAFPDGVIWVEVGQEPTVAQLQREVAHALGDPGLFETPSEGKGKLAELLANRAVLLVLDDVWEPGHAEAFDVLGPRCRMVMTTRDASLITALGGTEHQVHLLTEAESRHLLAEWADQPEEALPAEALQILDECDGLPLALALCGALAREGDPWADLLEALQEAELEFLDHPHGNMLRTLKVSVDRLTEDEAARFAELRAFPADETVPEDAVVTLWTHTGEMRARHARRLLATLKSRALVQVDGVAPNRRVSLHDLVRDYTARMAPEEEALHERVVEAYRAACDDDWASGPDDGYFFTHLRDHLAAAGEAEELAGIAMDLRWLEAKAEGGLVFDIPFDLEAARDAVPLDDPRGRLLRLIAQAVRTDLQFIAGDPTTLFQCLWNRCWWYDCNEAANHYDPPEGGWGTQGPPWERDEPRLCTLVERWREEKEQREPGFVWMLSLRPPPTALGGAQIACLRGHEQLVASVAVSPDGRRIVSGSRDETVRIWDVVSGEELACLRGHESGVWSVAVSPDGRRIVSGSADRTVRVWDANSGEELACLRGHEYAVWSVAISPDGRRIVSGSMDGTVRVWAADSGEELACLRGHEYPVYSVAVSPNGRRIVSGSDDHTVRVWDADSGEELACLRGHEHYVTSVAVSPDGSRIVSGSGDMLSRDNTVRIWDADSGEELACLRGHQGPVNSVAVSPDGRRIVSGGRRTVRVWDADSGEELACLRGHDSGVSSVAVSPDGRRIVSGSVNETRVWDAETFECIEVVEGSGNVEAIAGGATQYPLWALSRGEQTIIRDAATGREIAWFPISPSHIATHPSGRIWAGRGGDGTYLAIIALEGEPEAAADA